MAKKRKKSTKNRKNFVAIPFSGSLALLTLGNGSALSLNLLNAVFGEDIYIISLDILLTLVNGTAGEVPIIVGLNHSDLSATETVEALVAEQTDPDDIIAKERARRPVRKIGSFGENDTDQVMNDGRKIRQTVKMSIGDGHNLDIFGFNNSGAALTTGAIIKFDGTLYGRWQR